MSDCELTLIVPVFNEGKNFPALWEGITRQIRSKIKVLVVYDFDEDDTVPVVQRTINGGETSLHLVKNDIRRGVVGAILAGLRVVKSGPVMVVMADLCDDLSQVDQMLTLYRQGYDVVAGSRYMSGGKIINGPFLKQGLSRLAGLTLHWFRRIPTRDATNAFKLYDRDMLQSFTIESQAGFELNLELTVKAFLGGYHITEIPTMWKERSAGESRFRLWAWLPKYLKWYLYAFRPRRKSSHGARLERGSERGRLST
jgi:glycosyltransferase involved in cell wall biosynthesis